MCNEGPALPGVRVFYGKHWGYVAMNANFRRVEPYDKGTLAGRSESLAARLEPFDSYWQAPKDVEKGFTSFTAYYRANYLGHMPADKQARILVISCGPGYLVKILLDCGYSSVLGIDSDTAAVIGPDNALEVIGAGGVTVIDPAEMADSNAADLAPGAPIRITNLRLHSLTGGTRYDLDFRRGL